jgi:hypothetical protein
MDMVTHIKTTIDIADNLLLRAKARAQRENITLRALVERALAGVLEQEADAPVVRPVTFAGEGLNPEFEGASWDKIREAIYA